MSQVAEIGVRVVADASKLMSGLQKSLEAVDRFGKQVEKAANKIGAVGAAITALGGKLVADAAKYDGNVKGAVDRLGNAYNTLATRLGAALIPAVEELTKFVTRLVHVWDSLAPSQKQAIAHYAEMAAKILLVVAVGGKVVGMVGQLAGLASVLLPLIPALVAVAAGVVAVIAIMSALNVTWADVWNGAKKTAADSWNWLGATFGSVIDRILGFIGKMIRAWAEGVQKMLDVARPLFKLLGIEGVADFGKDLAGWIASLTTKNGWEDFATDGKKAISDIASRLKSLPDEVQKALRAAGLGSMLDAFSGSVGNLPKLGGGSSLPAGFVPKNYGSNIASTPIGPSSGAAGREERWSFIEQIKGSGATLARNLGDTFLAAGATIRDAVMAAAPKFAGMLQGAMQGGQAGGPWGAIIGAIAALLTQTQAFTVVMGLMEEGVGVLVKAINPIIKPLIVVSKAANIILDVLMRVVGPVFEMVGKAFFEVSKFIAKIVGGFVHAVQGVWNWIVNALWTFLVNIGLNDLAKSVSTWQMTTAKMDAALAAIDAATWENIDSIAASTAANDASAEAVAKFSESLTNVPQGFKVAAARFNAMSDGGGASSVAAEVERSGGMTVIVQGSIVDVDGLMQVINSNGRKGNFRRSGTPVPA